MSTTYMTGAVTGAVLTAVTRTNRDPIGIVPAQILVLLLAAGLDAVLLRDVPWFGAALPLLLVAAAIVTVIRSDRAHTPRSAASSSPAP